MVTNAFASILEELGKTSVISVLGLVPDKNNSCLLQIGDISLQVELDKTGEYLLLGSVLGVPSKGTYRTDLFRAALKANSYFVANPNEKRYGVFAYSTKTGNLILFELLPLNGLTGDKVGDFLVPFLDKAKVWSTAIKNNQMPPELPSSSKGVGGIFGLFK